MHPQICTIGHLTIFSYGLMLVIAFMLSTFLASTQAKKNGIDPDLIFNLSFVAFLSGIIGARIFYILYNLGYYRYNPLEIVMLQKGGLAWFGGLICGTLCSYLYLKAKKVSISKIADFFAPYLALAQAIGRIGCFLNGCCYGKESLSGIYFPVHGAILIPTQLYSSLMLIFIFIILRFLQERKHKQGEIFFYYLLFYSIKRFFIEFLRADNPSIFLGLTLFQLLSIAVFSISITKLWLIKKDNN